VIETGATRYADGPRTVCKYKQVIPACTQISRIPLTSMHLKTQCSLVKCHRTVQFRYREVNVA
jgi:hypothetical protein